MARRFLLAAAVVAALYPCNPVWAARTELIPETTAARHGLTRPWFTQVEIDRSRGKIQNFVLYDGTLYAQTDMAVLQAIDAETGRTLWCKQVGDPKQPTFPAGAYRDFLALINGSHLYVLNRLNGDLLFEKELNGAAGAGPALSSMRVYIPMSHGLMTAYRLAPPPRPVSESLKAASKIDQELDAPPPDDAKRRKNLRLDQNTPPPLVCQSYGQALVQPLVTRESSKEELVLWPTDRGYLNVARIDRKQENALSLKFRMTMGSPIVGQPAYLPPDANVAGDSGLIVAASRDGFVHAVLEKSGEKLWRFSTGEPVIEPPAVIEDHVYVSTQQGGMHCLAVKTGAELWYAPNALRFAAASKSRVYAADRTGRLLVLNAENGVCLDSIDTASSPLKLLNLDTDRIYLADEGGLVQCLHEIEQTEPLVHNKDRKQVEEVEEKPAVEQKEINDADMAEQEAASPRAKAAPREAAPPREKAAPKKAGKKKVDEDAEGGDADNPFGQGDNDPFGGGGDKAGKAGKAGKTGKAAKIEKVKDAIKAGKAKKGKGNADPF